MIVKNKYCTVKHSSGDIHISEYIENARIETNQTLNTYDKVDEVPENDISDMPDVGEEIVKDKIYSFQGKNYHAIQSHTRTIYNPDDTPALFSVQREDTGQLEWVKNEKVDAGDVRIYEGVEYECIQGHMTLESWSPDNTATLWKVYTGDEIAEWVQPTGGHDAYNTGDRVLYNGSVYESLIDANVWSPTTYPQGWQLIE